MTPERILVDKLKSINSQICCINEKLPDLDEVIFFSHIGTSGLPSLAVPGLYGKLYIDIDTGEQWIANPTGLAPYYIPVGKDVVEADDYAELLTIAGEARKIYVTLDDNKLYRWTGSTYVEVSSNNLDTISFEFMSGVLTSTFYAPFPMKITSVTNVLNAPTTTVTTTVGLTPYTLGTTINLGTLINVTVSTSSVVRLNIYKL